MTDTYTFDDFRESTVPWDMVPPIPPALSLASENNDDVTLSIIHKLDGYGRIKVAVIGIEELCGLKLYETLRHKKDFYVTGFSTYSSIENINIFDVVIYKKGPAVSKAGLFILYSGSALIEPKAQKHHKHGG